MTTAGVSCLRGYVLVCEGVMSCEWATVCGVKSAGLCWLKGILDLVASHACCIAEYMQFNGW